MNDNSWDLSEVDNLLRNMSSGLLPEDLLPSEVKMLEKEYGENWFNHLGYSEPEYVKPEKKNIPTPDQEIKSDYCSGLYHCKASEKTINLKDPKCKECVNEAFDALERMNIHYKED